MVLRMGQMSRIILLGLLLWTEFITRWTIGQSQTQRPAYRARSFHSEVVDSLIDTLTPLFKDDQIAKLFANCLPNTLDTTIFYSTPVDGSSAAGLDTFIITGDINAMWLRDSTNQVLPYLPYTPLDEPLRILVEGLIQRQARSISLDPLANAFNFNASGQGHQNDFRRPPMKLAVFEGKYELDSLAAMIKLSYWYVRFNKETSGAIERIATLSWLDAVEALLHTGNIHPPM